MRFRSTLAAILAAATLAGCKSAPIEPTAETNDDVILHAWCWSFNTIK